MKKITAAILATGIIAILIAAGGLYYRNLQLQKFEKSMQSLSVHIAENLSDRQLVEGLFMFLTSLPETGEAGSLRPGSVFLNARNIPTFPANPKEQNMGLLSDYLGEIRRAYIEEGAPPPFIALDQEGGPVRRIKSEVSAFPSQMAIGEAVFQSEQEDLPMLVGFYTCYELRRHGIHWPLGPVLDVLSNTNNPVIAQRAFSSDPGEVARMAKAWLSGLHSARCPDAIKHFPGHGDTSLDSHTHLPIVNQSLDELKTKELYPFTEIVLKENKADAIMSAHILFPEAAPEPATLSSFWLQEKLRKEWNFQGIIITDDLNMNAVKIYQRQNNIKNIFLETLNAGADMLLYVATPKLNDKAAASLLRALQNKEISRERLLVSMRRIIYAKIKYGVMDEYLKNSLETFSPELQEAAAMVIRHSAETDEKILRLESQLARSESINDFLSQAAIKTLVDEKPSDDPTTSLLLPFAQRQVEIPESYPLLTLYTDLDKSDPAWPRLKARFSRVLRLSELANDRGKKSQYQVILHTGSMSLNNVLVLKRRHKAIIYTTHTPLPARRYLPLLDERDYLITSFSKTDVSVRQLVETILMDKLPPKAHLKID